MNFRLRFMGSSFVALAFLGCQHMPPTKGSEGEPLWFQLETGNGRDERLGTEVKINNQSTRLGLDTGTGAPFVLFGSSVGRLKLKVAQSPSADPNPTPGRALFGQTAPCELQLFGHTFPAVPMYFAEMPAELSSKEDVAGMIGWPAVEDGIWAFFLGRDQPMVAALDDYSRSEMASWTKFSIAEGNTLSLKFAGDHPGFPRVIVDTGNDAGVLLPPLAWREWNAQHPTARKTIHGGFIPGQTIAATVVAWADELRIGNLLLRGVPVQEADAAYVVQAAPGEAIVALGLAALKRLDLIVDGKEKTAYAQAIDGSPPPYRHNRIGAQFFSRDSTSADLVAQVLAAGPAARAGLHEGDLLLKVNGWDVAGWRTHPEELHNRITMSAPAGTTWNFVVRRGVQIVRVVVVAEDLLGPSKATAK